MSNLDGQGTGQSSPLQRIRSLHVITGLTTGGAELSLCNLLERWDRSTMQPMVVSLGERGNLAQRLEASGVEVVPLDIGNTNSILAGARSLVRLINECSPDLIQGWMYHGNLAATVASGFARGSIPVLWNVRHSLSELDDEKRSTARLIRLGGRLPFRPCRIIYNSRASALQHETLGYSRRRRVIIPNGFDCVKFSSSPVLGHALREELGIDRKTILIGVVGRLHPTKDHRNFLEAARLLATERPELRFLCVGDGPGEYRRSLERLTDEMGLAGQVIWTGEREDMPAVYNALDLITSSSRGEAFPNAVGEAMACAVPCVVTDVGDSSWLVGDSGIVIPPRKPEALVAGWRELLDSGTEGRAARGAAARRRVRDRFSIRETVMRYAELYSEVLG